jgi:hypothetical protein
MRATMIIAIDKDCWHKRITRKYQNANDKTENNLEQQSSGTELHAHHMAPRGL